MDEKKLPPGFKFYPTDKQVLEDYLKPKIFGMKLPCDRIMDKEIYGVNANPWEIFNDSSTNWIISNKEKFVYIFTSLTKISDKGSSGSGKEHNVRKSGCGTWHGETGRKPIMDGTEHIGDKRMLVFQINDIHGLGDGVDLNMVGYWKIHEYFLRGCEDYVVCRVTFDMSKEAKVIKAVSGTPGGRTKSKANKKKTNMRATTKADNGKAVLIETSRILMRDSEKQVAPNNDFGLVDYSNNMVEGRGDCSYGLGYENQRCHEENNGMMIHQNGDCSYGLRYENRMCQEVNNGMMIHQNGDCSSGLSYQNQICQERNNGMMIYQNGDCSYGLSYENQMRQEVNNGMMIHQNGECSYGLSYENQTFHEENNGMMIHQNMLPSIYSVSRYGCDQGLVLNNGFPQYDNGGNCRIEDQEFQGLKVNDGQRLNYEEKPQPDKVTSGDFENGLGTELSNFNIGPDDDVYLDLDDLFEGGFRSDIYNAVEEQSMARDDVPLNFEDFFDIGSWSEKNMEKSTGQVNNDVQQQPS